MELPVQMALMEVMAH
jgi:hypothetical protein